MSELTHIYGDGESELAACGADMTVTNHTIDVPTCPECNMTYLAQKDQGRQRLLRDIGKLPDSTLKFLHRAVYLAKQDKRLLVNSYTNDDGIIGLDKVTYPPNTEFVLFTLYKNPSS